MIGMAIGLMAVGTAVSAYSTYSSGRAAQAMGEYNAEVSRIQAEADAAALKAEARHRVEADRVQYGASRAQSAGRGIDYETGSPLLVAAQEARENAYDGMELLRRQDIAIEGGRSESAMSIWNGDQERKASLLSAGGQLATGAGKMYSMRTPKNAKKPTD